RGAVGHGRAGSAAHAGVGGDVDVGIVDPAAAHDRVPGRAGQAVGGTAVGDLAEHRDRRAGGDVPAHVAGLRRALHGDLGIHGVARGGDADPVVRVGLAGR